MDSKTRKIVISALLTALTCVATVAIRIPSPLNGYINLGDGVVLLAGWMLSPLYGFLAAGIGSALADVFAGYLTYAPATFIIKGLMALIAFYSFKLFRAKLGNMASRIAGALLAECAMIAGYLAFESVLYGFVPSLVNVPANAVQGACGAVIGIALIKIFEKVGIKA